MSKMYGAKIGLFLNVLDGDYDLFMTFSERRKSMKALILTSAARAT
jgi:hypothetical protein